MRYRIRTALALLACATAARAQEKPLQLDVRIDRSEKDGRITYRANQRTLLSWDELEKRVKEFATEAKAKEREMKARVLADNKLPFAAVVKVLDLLDAQGVKHVELLGGSMWPEERKAIPPLPEVDPAELKDAIRLRVAAKDNDEKAWVAALAGGQRGEDGLDPRRVVVAVDEAVRWKTVRGVLKRIAQKRLHRVVFSGLLDGKKVLVPADLSRDRAPVAVAGGEAAVIGPKTGKPSPATRIERYMLLRGRVADKTVRWSVEGLELGDGEALERMVALYRLQAPAAPIRARILADDDVPFADVLRVMHLVRRVSIPHFDFLVAPK